MSVVIKQKKCKVCEDLFPAFSSLQKVCSPKCAIILVEEAKEKKKRREFRERKRNLRTVRDWTKLAQIQFNKFIRLRDKDLPCIDCGEFGSGEDHFTGGRWDAGHYLSVGGYPELRFNELNCHKQLKSCNGGSGKYAKKNRTVKEGYRIRLIEKIGIEKVKCLEGKHEPAHYSINDLKEIREIYRLKIKDEGLS